jgi:hypothetical protein
MRPSRASAIRPRSRGIARRHFQHAAVVESASGRNSSWSGPPRAPATHMHPSGPPWLTGGPRPTPHSTKRRQCCEQWVVVPYDGSTNGRSPPIPCREVTLGDTAASWMPWSPSGRRSDHSCIAGAAAERILVHRPEAAQRHDHPVALVEIFLFPARVGHKIGGGRQPRRCVTLVVPDPLTLPRPRTATRHDHEFSCRARYNIRHGFLGRRYGTCHRVVTKEKNGSTFVGRLPRLPPSSGTIRRASKNFAGRIRVLMSRSTTPRVRKVLSIVRLLQRHDVALSDPNHRPNDKDGYRVTSEISTFTSVARNFEEQRGFSRSAVRLTGCSSVQPSFG